MYTGQLNLSGPFDNPDQRIARGNGVAADGSENTFALLIQTALEASNMECAENGASGDLFDTEDDVGGLLNNLGSGGLGISFGGPSLSPFGPLAGQLQAHPGAIANLSGSQGGVTLNSATAVAKVREAESPAQDASLNGDLAAEPKVAGAINKGELSDWMDAHALTRSSHRCAMYCRMGMEAAGLSTADRPLSGDAGDYGPFLIRHGAKIVPQISYVPQAGDVAVFDKTSEHPFGHIQMYDGHQWVSDFVQHGMSPYRDASSTPPYTIYRFA
jgi:hypothetical protein